MEPYNIERKGSVLYLLYRRRNKQTPSHTKQSFKWTLSPYRSLNPAPIPTYTKQILRDLIFVNSGEQGGVSVEGDRPT
jgi:hypothetical protein